MIFDDDMINAVNTLRESGVETPRERAPRYRFEEYLPPLVKTPPLSIDPRRMSDNPDAEYEMDHFSRRRHSSDSVSTADDDTSSQDPRRTTLSTVKSAPPLLPLPDLPPPSPSLSFHSYDWYQDIIGDGAAGPPTPTLPDESNPMRMSRRISARQSYLVPPAATLQIPDLRRSALPEPLSPGLRSKADEDSRIPANPEFRLSPTVYQAPARASQLPYLPPVPPTPPPKSNRLSAVSNMTRTTRNSRNWLPDNELYLPEEGTMDSWKKLRRPSNVPTTYSPLA